MVKCVVKNCMSRSEKINKASGITFHKYLHDLKCDLINLSLPRIIWRKLFFKFLPKHTMVYLRRGINVFRQMVPQDRERMEEWIKNIRLLRKETDWLPSTATVICSKHFQERDKILPQHDKGRIRLSDKAVPVVIDETDALLTEMEEDLNVETDEEMLNILDTSQNHKMRKTIKRLKFVASNRLKCIQKLRQKNRRLMIKNKKLLDIIKEMKNKRHICKEEIYLDKYE